MKTGFSNAQLKSSHQTRGTGAGSVSLDLLTAVPDASTTDFPRANPDCATHQPVSRHGAEQALNFSDFIFLIRKMKIIMVPDLLEGLNGMYVKY